jgi:hypothetical protein
VTAGAGGDIEGPALLGKSYMLINQLCEPLAPIGGDKQVVKKSQLLVGFVIRHV